MKQSCITLAFCILFAACHEKKTEKVNQQHRVPTAADVEHLLNETDSLDVLFFDDPFGDSLRYTRFYSYAVIDDTSQVNILKQQMQLPVMLKENLDTCRSEGKMYLFRKKDPVKTIYFSLRPGCHHLYFIKDGNYYYINPGNELQQLLSEVKSRALKKDQ